MNLSNDDQMFAILSKGAPELLEVYQAMKANDVDAKTLVSVCGGIAEASKSKVSSVVNIHVDNKRVTGITQKHTDAESWNEAIAEAKVRSGISDEYLLKGLFLIANVKNISGWGKVVYLIQNKEIVRVTQEQGFKVE